jgi:hypothetical protein
MQWMATKYPSPSPCCCNFGTHKKQQIFFFLLKQTTKNHTHAINYLFPHEYFHLTQTTERFYLQTNTATTFANKLLIPSVLLKQCLAGKETAMFVGSVLLGFIHLIGIGLEFAYCSHREFIFLPILQFGFVFLIMHFAFSQSRNGCKLGFSNIALSHLLVTQITLWLVHFDRNYGSCGYSHQHSSLTSFSSLSLTMPTNDSGASVHSHETTNTHPHVILSKYQTDSSSSSSSQQQQPLAAMVPSAAITAAAAASGYPFSGILVPVIHHYQLLTITILSTIWLANNHADSFDPAFNLLTGFSNADSEFGYQYFKKKASIKGFFVGLLMTSGTIVVLVLKDHQLSLITHTLLLVRRMQSFAAHIWTGTQHLILMR